MKPTNKISKHYTVLAFVMLFFALNFIFFRKTEFFWSINYFIITSYIILLYIGVTRHRLNYFFTSINSGIKKGISLTFDDGPNTQFTEKVLDILKRKNVKACFFIIGDNIQGNEKILQRIYNEGHIVGNHSFGHKYWFNSLPSAIISKEILKNASLIKSIIGKEPIFYRTPFGLCSPNVARGIKKAKVISIGWDFRSFDTMAKDKNILLEKLQKAVSKSTIMLLHDNNIITTSILEEFIDYCITNGIEIVPLDKMIGLKAYK